MSTKARERSRAMREARAAELARQQRQHRILQIAGSVVIVGLLVAIVFAVGKSMTSNTEAPKSTGEVVVPANTDAGAFSVGKAGAPVTLELYYDYMCSSCGRFEATNGTELTRLIEDGTLRVDLRVLSFLDQQSKGTEYSTRAANAYATVVNGAPDTVWDFHSALYANQPREGTTGLSDAMIADIAEQAGVPADVVDKFTDATYRGWVAKVTQDGVDAGVDRTPTVKINGSAYTGDWSTPGELTKAIENAAAGTS